jgi:hypothetical protein
LFSPVHIVAGMALAKVVPGGEIPVFLAAVLSHLALDAVPHGDTGIGHWVDDSPDRRTKLTRLLSMSLADQLVALFVFLCLYASPIFSSVPFSLLLAGAVGSMFPDYCTGIRDLCPKPPKFLEAIHRFHNRCHFRGRDPFSIAGGLIFQILLVLSAIFLAWRW